MLLLVEVEINLTTLLYTLLDSVSITMQYIFINLKYVLYVSS